MADRNNQCWNSARFTSGLRESRRTLWFLSTGQELPKDVVLIPACGGRVCIRPWHMALRMPKGRTHR